MMEVEIRAQFEHVLYCRGKGLCVRGSILVMLCSKALRRSPQFRAKFHCYPSIPTELHQFLP